MEMFAQSEDMLLFYPASPTRSHPTTAHPHPTPQVTKARRQTTKREQMVTFRPPNCLISRASFLTSLLSPTPSNCSFSDCRIPAPPPPPHRCPLPVYLSVCLFVFAASLQKQAASSPVIDAAAERCRAETRCLPARPGMRFTRLTTAPPPHPTPPSPPPPPPPFCLRVYMARA